MKKSFFLFIFPLIFVFSFLSLELKSYAYLADPNYDLPTDDIIIESYSTGSKYGTTGVGSSQVCRYVITISGNSAYNRQGMGVHINREWPSEHLTQLVVFNQYDLFNAIGYTPENGAFAYWTEDEYIGTSTEVISTHTGVCVNGGSGSGYGQTFNVYTEPINYSVKQGVFFEDEESARNYLRYGDEDGIISGLEDIENARPVLWGEGGNPNDPYSTADPTIPVPQVQVVNENAYGTHKIRILNNEFDDRLQANGTYGVVCNVLWYSCNGFTFQQTNKLGVTYKTFYDDLVYGDHNSYIYPIPQKLGDVQLCPRYIDFNTNANSLTNFSSMLTSYPVSSRDIQTPGGNRTDFLSDFQTYLTLPKCPYNSCVFELYFLKKDDDGYMHFGPKFQGYFETPAQGTVMDFYYLTLDPDDPPIGSIEPDPGGGDVKPDPKPVVPPIDPGDGGEVDTSQVVQNMRGILSLVGDFPDFMRAVFSFFPEWIFNFIVVAIGILVAIGLVKFFLG